jgi:protein-disulfide isomerase
MHAHAQGASVAAAAAQKQGKFWEMHDLIFEKTNWRAVKADTYVQYAQELGLDVEKFKKDVASSDVKKQVDGDSSEAARLGVTGTPAFFVNGKFLSGAQPFESFKRLIDEELKG